MNKIGDRLRQLRLNKNLSLSELAQQIGIAKSTLSKYEHNERIPGGDILRKLANYYNVDTDYILGLHKNDNVKMHIFEILKKRGIVNSLDEEISDEQLEKIKEILDKALEIYNLAYKNK